MQNSVSCCTRLAHCVFKTTLSGTQLNKSVRHWSKTMKCITVCCLSLMLTLKRYFFTVSGICLYQNNEKLTALKLSKL